MDHGVPWRQDRRPALRRLMRTADAGAFTIVLVPDLAHFACSGRHAVRALATFAARGIRFVTADSFLDTRSAEGAAMLALVDAIVQLQREITHDRVRRLHQRREKNRRPGARPRLRLVVSSRATGVASRDMSRVAGRP